MLAFAAGAALLLGASACAPQPDDTEGGMGLPLVKWLPEPPTGGEAIAGTLLVASNGCFHLDIDGEHLFALWPDDFEHAGAEVRTGDGTMLGEGDSVEGEGTVLSHEAAVELGGGEDSQLGSAIGYCAEGLDIVVLTEVTPSPTASTMPDASPPGVKGYDTGYSPVRW